MVSMNRTSSLLLLCSFCSGAVVSTLTSNTTLSGEHKTACRESETWTAPQWPPSVIRNCRRIIERLQTVEPESLDQDGFVYEFLPRGQRTRRPEPEVVRTPWKLTDGPCTMAITTLAQIPAGWLPTEVGPGPFPDSGGLKRWWSVRLSLLYVMEQCVDKSEGGLSWFVSEYHPSLTPAMGFFFFATDSAIDRAIGPGTNPGLVLPGINFTASSSMAILNTTS